MKREDRVKPRVEKNMLKNFGVGTVEVNDSRARNINDWKSILCLKMVDNIFLQSSHFLMRDLHALCRENQTPSSRKGSPRRKPTFVDLFFTSVPSSLANFPQTFIFLKRSTSFFLFYFPTHRKLVKTLEGICF